MNKRIAGIDIGGTKIRGVLWNGKKVLRASEATTPKTLTAFKSTLAELIKYLGETDKIAIGMAGVVKKSKVVKSPNIPYMKDFDFSGIDGWKILDNDARCFGRAEYKIGNAVGRKTAFFITIGTGLGRAVGRKGKILKIKKFEHPEPWEKEYKKLRNKRNNRILAQYLDKKLSKLINPFHPQIVIVGGGTSARKGFFAEFKKISKLPLKKSKLGKNAAAIGAAISL